MDPIDPKVQQFLLALLISGETFSVDDWERACETTGCDWSRMHTLLFDREPMCVLLRPGVGRSATAKYRVTEKGKAYAQQ